MASQLINEISVTPVPVFYRKELGKNAFGDNMADRGWNGLFGPAPLVAWKVSPSPTDTCDSSSVFTSLTARLPV